MKNILITLFIISFLSSCGNGETTKNSSTLNTAFEDIIKDDYELSKPSENIKNVLVLFGGYPESAQDIKREFKILEVAHKNGIAVLFMNFSQKLWLEESEKQALANKLQNIFKENELPTDNTYVGGFSSGGNVALLMSAFLAENTDLKLEPKGVFIVDSPIDLAALYRSSEKNLARNFSEVSVQESTWLIENLEQNFGDLKNNLAAYEKYSVFSLRTNGIDKLRSLRNMKIRLYTEPDTLWWKENRMADYDQMNAMFIERLSEALKKSGFTQVEYIPTKNRGYRANGQRHPHSWGIVDEKELMEWIR